ncbi:CLUMA_CG007123, isoform A [Clunio marinus]|uniref:CLUMA_CG007123, isoform A n=1 Tax=Clunio marinus TaxID=568069 RepID=A0A1J1I3Z5_9DIPT|nr:CLUMA_CG007123, isoform A [Clunio marinus]
MSKWQQDLRDALISNNLTTAMTSYCMNKSLTFFSCQNNARKLRLINPFKAYKPLNDDDYVTSRNMAMLTHSCRIS